MVADLPAAETEEEAAWPEATVSPKGESWQFDLFSPPLLYAVPSEQGWSPSPAVDAEPGAESQAAPTLGSSGVRVIEIVQDVFPVRLLGFGRSPRGTFGVFQYVDTKETALAREGERLIRAGLSVVGLDAGRITGAADAVESSPLPRARVVDAVSGVESVLEAGENLSQGEAWAVLEIPGRDDRHWMQAGDHVVTSGGTLVLERIDVRLRRAWLGLAGDTNAPTSAPTDFNPPLRLRAVGLEAASAAGSSPADATSGLEPQGTDSPLP